MMNEISVEKLYETLDELFAEKKTEQVEPFLKNILDTAEKDERYGIAVAACNELGGFFRMTSRYNEAAELYDKALQYLEYIGAGRGQDFATTQINYATTLSMSGRYDEALDMYNAAIIFFDTHGIETDYRAATLYNNMSSIYQEKGDTDTAARYLKKALSILENLEESNIEIAITYSNLANLYIKTDNIEEAEKYAEDAVVMFKENSAEKDVHYSAAICTLGDVYFAKGDYEKAADLFETALKFIERDYGKDNDNYKTALTNMLLSIRKKQEKE